MNNVHHIGTTNDDHLTGQKTLPKDAVKITKESATRFHHLRNHGKRKKLSHTVALIIDPDYIYVGISQCSKKDQFSRKIGRDVAEGRAKLAKAYDEGREKRRTAWALLLHRKAFGLDKYKVGDPRLDKEVLAIAVDEISAIRRERS